MVLLILAGVSISMVAGDNGILTQAVNASKNTDVAQTKEEIELVLVGKYDNNGRYVKQDVIDVAEEVTGNEVDLDTETVLSVKGNEIDISYLLSGATSNIIKIYDESGNYVATYTDLSEAISNATNGSNVVIGDGTYTIEETITISNDLTISGYGAVISGSCHTVIGLCNNVIFKNIEFNSLRSSTKTGTFVRLSCSNVKIAFESCSFVDNQWDAFVAEEWNGYEIEFCDCLFATTEDDIGHDHDRNGTIDADEVGLIHRYIHIEYNGDSETSNIKVTITGCTFNNMDKCDDDGITIGGVSLDNIYVGNNKTDNETNFTNDIWIETSSSTYWYQYSNIDSISSAFLGDEVVNLSSVVE